MKTAYILPPIAPVVAILLFGGFVYLSTKFSDPIILDGRVDNAPLRASMIVPFLTPLLYGIFAAINAAESLLDRWLGKLQLASTAITIVLCVFGMHKLIYSPEVDGIESETKILLVAIGISAVLIAPMSLWRKWINRKEVEQVPAGDAVPLRGPRP